MNRFADIREAVIEAVQALELGADLPLDAITVEPPKDASHGDASTNAAMVLAKAAGQNPRVLAEAIVGKMRQWDVLQSIDIAGAGFINFRFKSNFWQAVLPAIHAAGQGYGDSSVGKGVRVNVEYVSANPTGPLHIGHARGAVFGDALALLLAKAGYSVTKEYYINDAGGQVDVLAKSAYLRYHEACGEAITIPAGLYPGEYLIPVGQALKATFGDGLAADDACIKPFAIEAMMNLIRTDLADLGVVHDVFTSEKSLQDSGGIERAVEVLRGRDLIYRGVLEPPKGKAPDDWEPREQVLFKSSEFGDDVDRALQKSDGSYTYFAGDLALSQDKISRGFDELIYVFGADHGGYKKRMESSIKALSDGKVKCTIKLCQLVHLMRAGEPVKMSKRAGNFETVRDVLDAVGKDILRFVMLTRKNDVDMDFDLEKVKEQSKDNPVFYVQYAHARAKSLHRLAALEMPDVLAIDAPNYALLTHEAELRVIKEAAQFPRIVEAAARAAEPHRIAYYLHELAAAFHGLWHVGSKDADLRILVPSDPQLTAARLGLAKAVAVVLACGLSLLGVEPKEEL